MTDVYYHGPERLTLFQEGLAAAVHRLNRAIETRSALEYVVLSAAVVDGVLRMGLILKNQLDTHSSDFDEKLIHQQNEDMKRGERWVIEKAGKAGVIPQGFREDLMRLYERRNKCIHRYIISDVNYSFVTQLVFDYADAMERLNQYVGEMEIAQLREGVGFVVAEADTAEPNYDAEMKRWTQEMAARKDARPNADA
jgi:hypothetical protein